MEHVTRAEQLPEIGAPESNHLDFKKTYRRGTPDSFDGFELGKDIAGFANAMGGTILVGVQEAASVLHMYLPLDDDEARFTIRAIEEAVRDRCSPSPVVVTTKIPKDSGYIVAVNVSPFPGQPIGVRVKGDKNDGYGDPAWTFPVRVGTQTKYFRPEQLAMLMSAEYRRIAILLGGIRKNDVVSIRPTERDPSRPQAEYQFYFEDMDVLRNLVVFRQYTHDKKELMVVPMDQVVTVWRADTIWRLGLRGSIELSGASQAPFYRP